MLRRPDLPHIPLTCENTHTVMPYIDLVNEVLEYYVAHEKLEDKAARDTGSASTEDLLAEPQHVEKWAYQILAEAVYPLVLPFDLWIETVRAFCDQFESPLHRLLELLMPGPALHDPAAPFDRAAGFMESLGLSPSEVRLLTQDLPPADWYKLFGYDDAATAMTKAADAETGQRIDLNSAKALSRRLGVNYKEIVEIVQTRFVNPASAGMVLMHKLGVNVQDVRLYRQHHGLYDNNKDLIDARRDALSYDDRQRFDALAEPVDGTGLSGWGLLHEIDSLTQRLDDLAGGAAPLLAEMDDALKNAPLGEMLVLVDADAGCSFDRTELVFADGSSAKPIDFLRINLFVRLWRKLGWDIGETDTALSAFVFNPDRSRRPMSTVLIYLAHLKSLDTELELRKHGGPAELAAFWTGLPAAGNDPLYDRLFLSPGGAAADPTVFDDPLGRYLTRDGVKLVDHLLAVQGALGLTAAEIGRVLQHMGLSLNDAELKLGLVTMLYRHGLLAKGLRCTVDDLVTLLEVSGFEPFRALEPGALDSIDDDHPLTQTLGVVEADKSLKTAGLKIADLSALLRHSEASDGKNIIDHEAATRVLRALGDGIQSIEAVYPIPAETQSVTEESVRQVIGLALPSKIAEAFLAMMDATIEYTAVVHGGEAIDPAVFTDEKAVRSLTYDGARQEHKLVFRGVLLDAQRDALEQIAGAGLEPAPAADFGKLLDDVQKQARGFFKQYLQAQPAGTRPVYGFLDEAADYERMFEPSASEQDLQARRLRLSEAFVPRLRSRLANRLAVETVTSETDADAGLIEALLTERELLSAEPGAALLSVITRAGERGLTAEVYESTDFTGPARVDATLSGADTALAGNGPLGSARFTGYIEVPEAGSYRFLIELEKAGARGELRLDHLPNPALVTGVADAPGASLGTDPGQFVDLQPGVAYRVELSLSDLAGGRGRLLVQSQTSSRQDVSAMVLRPAKPMDAAGVGLGLLSKLIRLAELLGLNERELRHLSVHAAKFGGIQPSRLIGRTDNDASLSDRFAGFMRLVGYSILKQELVGGDDGLINVFDASLLPQADRMDAAVYPRLAEITRQDTATIKSTAQAVFGEGVVPAFENELVLRRVWDVLKTANRFGVPAASLRDWTAIVARGTSGDKRAGVALGLRKAIRTRYDQEAWRKLAQPLYDKLRQKKRDALVAHTMQLLDLSSIEQLYEYFLIDPGMEPVVQTSRIRLAIGTVQLFIQRCLLNLEKQVSPSALSSKRWAWMKRYRVWEANRKIFLYPENWLEPEFRDDKSHLFSELEGTLLQGDVSGDLAEDALLAYLRKLDEIARLDIAAIHLEDNDDPAQRTLHVFGRTFASPYQYFYRRMEYGVWTPWEPVSADISGDHLAPVVWRGRLFLFWVTFMAKPTNESEQPLRASGSVSRSGDISSSDLKQILDEVKTKSRPEYMKMQAKLNWSSYLNGEWSPTSSGGPGEEIGKIVPRKTMIADEGLKDYDPGAIAVHVDKEYSKSGELGIYIILKGQGFSNAFYLASRNSTVEPRDLKSTQSLKQPFDAGATVRGTRLQIGDGLSVNAPPPVKIEEGVVVPTHAPVTVILEGSKDKPGQKHTLTPCNNNIDIDTRDVRGAMQTRLERIASLIKPAFYHGELETLMIMPEVTERKIETYGGWVSVPVPTRPIFVDPKDPPKPQGPDPIPWPVGPIPTPRGPWGPLGPNGPRINPGVLFEHSRIKPDINLGPTGIKDWLVNPGSALKFDDAYIGPRGSVKVTEIDPKTIHPIDQPLINLADGDNLGDGTRVLVRPDDLTRAGLDRNTNQVDIIGGSGINTRINPGFTNFNAPGANDLR